jgi:hypothetical protein
MALAKKSLAITLAYLKPNFLPEKNLGSPSSIFEKKIDLCEKGDEITPFDGTERIEGGIYRLNMESDLQSFYLGSM